MEPNGYSNVWPSVVLKRPSSFKVRLLMVLDKKKAIRQPPQVPKNIDQQQQQQQTQTIDLRDID